MKSYPTIDGPININKITWLADEAVKNYLKDLFIMVVVHGPARLGKSSYVSLSCAETYEIVRLINIKFDEYAQGKDVHEIDVRKKKVKIYQQMKQDNVEIYPDWNAVKEFFVFKPREFIRISRKISSKKPMVIMDDSGKWLNAKDHASRFVKSVTKNLETLGTAWGTLVFTCKNMRQLVSLARDDPDVYTIHIYDWSQYSKDGLMPQRRIAKVHKGWESEDTKKSGKKWIDQNPYYAWMNDEFYQWYKEKRDALCNEGFIQIERELDRLIEEGDVQFE